MSLRPEGTDENHSTFPITETELPPTNIDIGVYSGIARAIIAQRNTSPVQLVTHASEPIRTQANPHLSSQAQEMLKQRDHLNNQEEPIAAKKTIPVGTKNSPLSETGKEILANRAARPHDTQNPDNPFAHTTATAVRAETAEQGLAIFKKVFSDCNMIDEIQIITPGSKFCKVQLSFNTQFQRVFGVSCVDALIHVQPSDACELVSEQQVVVIYNPNADETNEKAFFYAQILAFFGLWDRVGSSTHEKRVNQNPSNKYNQARTDQQLKLVEIESLFGHSILELLKKHASTIASNHRRLLGLLSQKSTYSQPGKQGTGTQSRRGSRTKKRR